MKKHKYKHVRVVNEKGVSAILVGIMVLMFFGFTALAIETWRIFVIRGELQNAADAGALAGTRFLYTSDGKSVNPVANQIAKDAATENKSEKIAVEVRWPEGTDVQRGHWCFSCNGGNGLFTSNDSLGLCDLWRPKSEIDTDTTCINAIKVITRREDTPPTSIFGRIWNKYKDNLFPVRAQAVAYLGSSGSFAADEVDMPLAICDSAIEDENGNPLCTIGRMINSGPDVATNNTGGWTSFNQGLDGGSCENLSTEANEAVCSGGTNANEIKELIDPPGPANCVGHPENGTVCVNAKVATLGGEAESAFMKLRDCWLGATDTDGDGVADIPWGLKLPVITCPGNNIGTCETVTGVVSVNVLWITRQGESTCQFESTTTIIDPVTGLPITTTEYNYPPLYMYELNEDGEPTANFEWVCSEDALGPDGVVSNQAEWDACWSEFVAYYNLQNQDEEQGTVPAPCQKKAIYFAPSCDASEPTGGSGGENFGIMSKIPVLVR